jgi:Xaa-Pro dipeptidase
MRQVLSDSGLDVLVLRLPENILMLSGYWLLNGPACLVFPTDGTGTLILPSTEAAETAGEIQETDLVTYPAGVLDSPSPYAEIERLLADLGRASRWKHVGFDGEFPAVAPAWNAAEVTVTSPETNRILERAFGPRRLRDASEVINAARLCKTDYELQKLRLTNEVARFGLQAFHESVDVGVSGVELVSRVESAIMEQGTGYGGARRVRAFAQVAGGAAEASLGYRPMEIPTTRKLESGDVALLELATVVDGFWSDRTRVRVAGTPSDDLRERFDAVKRAQRAAVDEVRAGAAAGAADKAARDLLTSAGFGEEFIHITGHGLGFRYHELGPTLGPGAGEVLQPGMVHSVEPGVYGASFGGIRLEDDVAVTADGCEVLAPFENELV